MENKSLWIMHNKNAHHYPKLGENIDVEVVIIGGGITGVSTALQLANAGKKIAIIEAHQIGGTTTSSSTGNLYVPVQPYYHSIIDKFNLNIATQVAHSRSWAIEQIEKNIQDYQIECQFSRRPWFAYTLEKKESLEKELEAFKKMGFDANYTPHIPFPFHFKKAMILPHQARFNPLQYVLGLTEQLVKHGVLIYEKSPVLIIKEDKTPKIYTEHGSITAQHIVIATHTPINFNRIQSYTAPYRSYVIASTSLKEYPDAHCWNMDRVGINSISTHGVTSHKPELLMLAGQHHKTGQGENLKTHFFKLSEFLHQHFPESEIDHQWSAQHYHSADDIPYIGRAKALNKNIYIGTGYFADGLVYGTLAGYILANTILEKKVSYRNIYAPTRSSLMASLPFLLKQNFNVFLQYLKDLPTAIRPKKNLLAGQACILEINQQKYAAYRDLEHKVHVVSAVCTHMKCIVNWNDAEKTWDCPCHGSRFSITGKVIEGPATCDLQQYHGILT